MLEMHFWNPRNKLKSKAVRGGRIFLQLKDICRVASLTHRVHSSHRIVHHRSGGRYSWATPAFKLEQSHPSSFFDVSIYQNRFPDLRMKVHPESVLNSKNAVRWWWCHHTWGDACLLCNCRPPTTGSNRRSHTRAISLATNSCDVILSITESICAKQALIHWPSNNSCKYSHPTGFIK